MIQADLYPVTKDDYDNIKDDWLSDNVCSFASHVSSLNLLTRPTGDLVLGGVRIEPGPVKVSSAERARYLEHEKLEAIPNANINLLRPSMVRAPT